MPPSWVDAGATWDGELETEWPYIILAMQEAL